MKEIGGYFGMEQLRGSAYHRDLIAVNNGRNALVYLLKARQIRKLYLPLFLCDSVSNVCRRENCQIAFYSIGEDFHPRFSDSLRDDEWLYLVNYYGQLSNAAIQTMKRRWDRIIVDNVQAFFQRPVPGVDTVYSCRKFFGVPDGGYVATDACLPKLPEDISKDRMTHILGRYEGTASEYYSAFKANDMAFRELPLRGMSRLTRNFMTGIDYAFVKNTREENYRILADALGETNRLQLTEPEGPYAYPYYCPNGMEVKTQLAKQGIYVATLWPNLRELEGCLERDYAENILPLPCDQRYGQEDMLRIIAQLRKLCC